MKQLGRKLFEHWQVVLAVTILTLVMTFPTIVYVFKTDAFWLPTRANGDIFIKLWDLWYGKLVLTGSADRYFTDLMFYPEGLSLVNHPLHLPHIAAVNALMSFLPLFNAFNLSYLLIIITTALSAYVYMSYLFKEKWLALFGTILFAFSPQVLSHFNHPDFMFLAPLPLCLYFFHRGFKENRLTFLIISGLILGLTTEMNLYLYVCIVLTLALAILAFAVRRRNIGYWRLVAVFLLTTGVFSFGRLYPLISDTRSLSETVVWHGERDRQHDLISYFVNYSNSFTGPIFKSIIKPPERAEVSKAAYLGILPLALICAGLFQRDARRRMLPWLGLLLLFFVLSLGPILIVNGVRYPGFLLPKHYLNQLFPAVFRIFWSTEHFIMGMILPLAILATWGLRALQEMSAAARRPVFALLLIGLVAAEYYIPIEEDLIENDRFAFLEWLAHEEDADIRLVNLPMGRTNAKLYNLYQAMSGYPNVEGAISRTPAAAFEYIYANPILGEWYKHRPLICGFENQNEYLGALEQLAADGFSHVVFHRWLPRADKVAESFSDADAAYSDRHVSIYRISDLGDACPQNFVWKKMPGAQAAEILSPPSVIHERHGAILGFQNDLWADEKLLRRFSQATFDQKRLVSIVSDEESGIAVHSSHETFRDLDAISAVNDAVWLINNPQQTDLTRLDIFVNWFTEEFRFCRRYLEQDNGTIDLYVKPEIPCAQAQLYSEDEIRYDNGIRLTNIDIALDAEQLTFYLSWVMPLDQTYSFSIQIFNAQGDKLLQYDNTIERQPVYKGRIDHALARGSELTVNLIVYDYETGKSVGGLAQGGTERFERELKIAAFEL